MQLTDNCSTVLVSSCELQATGRFADGEVFSRDAKIAEIRSV